MFIYKSIKNRLRGVTETVPTVNTEQETSSPAVHQGSQDGSKNDDREISNQTMDSSPVVPQKKEIKEPVGELQDESKDLVAQSLVRFLKLNFRI